MSQKMLEATFGKDPHAVLLTGKEGIGLATVARHYAKATSKIVRIVSPEKDDKVDLDKGTITVDSVRRLYMETRLREPKGRVVIIDYMERMGAPAQNAFLKLLEEPTDGTSFILLTHAPARLLPTILSRAQRIDLRPVSNIQSEAILDDLKVTDAVKRTQLLFIAKGLPALLTRLAQDDDLFAARAGIVRDAREYANGRAYQRLLLAKKYKDSRENALILLEDAMKMLRTEVGRQHDDARYLKLISRFEYIHGKVTDQGNVRLQLSAAAVVY